MPSQATWSPAAAAGDQVAWDGIVERYHRLVWAVVRSYRLSSSDAADVTQITWLRLVEHGAQATQQSLVLGVHSDHPCSVSTARNRSRHRPRVGPMLPTGMPSALEISS